jgi:RNA polymerase sigma-70 factor (ECF subfamily)
VPAALTDLDLIEGIRNASESHFDELYSRYFQRIYNFVYGRIRNHADAEEIVQETFTIVFSSMDKYSERSSLLSWIYGIARNTTNNGLRQAKNSSLRMQEIGHEQLRPAKSFASCTPEEQLSIQRYLKNVVEQLEDFGAWQVEIFDMRHLQNLSIREISKRTQRSSDSVRSCLYRVKRVLLETAQLDAPR